jgi:PD-(D/E)XK nuclease superfamily
MNFTNRSKLPQYLADWLVNDNYDHNTEQNVISATTLMKPIRVRVLTRRYAESTEVDVLDLIASRMGTAIHDSIEKISTPNVKKEERVSRVINVNGVDFTITGKYDILTLENNKWTLRDIKTTSVWAYIFGGKDEEYQKQLSIYRWILDSMGIPLNDEAFIDFIFTDWQSVKAKTEDNYPQQRISPGYPIKLLSISETEEYIRKKIEEILVFENSDDDDLPECTQEELWASEDTFAIRKPGAKKATKVCASKKEAEEYILDKKIEANIEFRKGKAKRCNYCQAAPFCNQYNRLLSLNQINNF